MRCFRPAPSVGRLLLYPAEFGHFGCVPTRTETTRYKRAASGGSVRVQSTLFREH